MSVAISPFDASGGAVPPTLPPRGSNVHGEGRVVFAANGEGKPGARLKDLYQRDPLRILFPVPPRGEIPSAVFVTTSGGMVGGDALDIAGATETGAYAQLTAQAAEKVYRSNGADCRIDVDLNAAADSWLEWLPQETIVFDGARLIRRTHAEVAPGARLLAGEFVVLGRTAMGETVATGIVVDEWEIRRDGRLIWADALRLDGNIPGVVAHAAGLGGANAMATAVYAADDAPDFLDTLRRVLGKAPAAVRVGATVVNGVLLARFLSADALALRQAFGAVWKALRNAAAGLPAELPKLWHI